MVVEKWADNPTEANLISKLLREERSLCPQLGAVVMSLELQSAILSSPKNCKLVATRDSLPADAANTEEEEAKR